MDKWRKKCVAEQQNRIKPTVCQKYVKMVLASSLMHSTSSNIGQELIQELQRNALNFDWKYEVEDLPVRDCIVWKRCVGQQTLSTTNDASTAAACMDLSESWQIEDVVVRLLTVQDLQAAARKGCMTKALVDNMRLAYPGKRYTLFILGEHKRIATHARALAELQLLEKVNVMQLPSNACELLEELQRLTKAIAEIPYKRKEASLQEGFKKFLANDNKNCVRVEGSHGFGRLWQQHLNRLPLVTLEVAETLIAQYPCPKYLLDEYERNADAVDAIADLKIRRSGPAALQTADRRIGRVMSEKLHTLYHARDPNALI